MENITEGLWRWTARHPEWHPGDFGDEVAGFAADAGDGTLLLIDPLLPPDPEPVLHVLDERAGAAKRVAILISIPYHVRSSEELWKRYRKDAEVTIHGHRACTKRLKDKKAFREIDPAVPLPAGVTAHAIGKPRRYETPLHVPSHSALVFGDAVAETDGPARDVVGGQGGREGGPLLPRAVRADAGAPARARLRPGARDPRPAGDEEREDGARERAEGEAVVPPRVGCSA